MRFVPTRIHGVIDWLMGALLLALPWLLSLDRGSPEGYIPMALGAATLVVTFFTDHEYGVVRRLPMVGHLWFDGLSGALLALRRGCSDSPTGCTCRTWRSDSRRSPRRS